MAYRDPKDRQAQQRRYRQTPEGREAHRRSVAASRARQRASAPTEWQTNPAPIVEALSTWRTQC